MHDARGDEGRHSEGEAMAPSGPQWRIRNGYARLTDLDTAEWADWLGRLSHSQRRFLQATGLRTDDWHLGWPADALHQFNRQWEYPYVARALGQTDGKRILDAGAGFTFFPFFLAEAGYEVTCVDLDRRLAADFDSANSGLCQHVPLVLADLKAIPFRDNAFDQVYCISVMEHTPDHSHILRELARVLRDGGRLILTCDVSLDGTREIRLPDLFELLGSVEHFFEHAAPRDFELDQYCLSSTACARSGLGKLPWRVATGWQRLLSPRYHAKLFLGRLGRIPSLAVAGMVLAKRTPRHAPELDARPASRVLQQAARAATSLSIQEAG